ncbi:hypothetical protein DMUE_0434 [Dictyocoela muelleri]|nr:hypothetical protein DMUE_0434 [Dictyocoela muelleri]
MSNIGDVAFIRRFAPNKNLSLLMDGTFKCSSNSLFQLYIIYGNYGDHMFPLLYCFLERKPESTYVRMFNAINSSLARYEILLFPIKIQIDYEISAFNPIKR